LTLRAAPSRRPLASDLPRTGEVARGLLLRGFQGFQDSADFLEDGLDIFENFVVPESQDGVALAREPFVSNDVVGVVEVLAAVGFDDDSGVVADKIWDVTSDGVLSSEFHAELVSAQVFPEVLFGVGHVVAQFAASGGHDSHALV
jgi:hypothetical protein